MKQREEKAADASFLGGGKAAPLGFITRVLPNPENQLPTGPICIPESGLTTRRKATWEGSPPVRLLPSQRVQLKTGRLALAM